MGKIMMASSISSSHPTSNGGGSSSSSSTEESSPISDSSSSTGENSPITCKDYVHIVGAFLVKYLPTRLLQKFFPKKKHGISSRVTSRLWENFEKGP